MMRVLLIVSLALAVADAFAASPPEHADAALERRLAAIAAAAPGRMGVVAKNLRSGAVARVNADAPVPLMSVCKLPIAVAALEGVDRGWWTLDRRVRLRARDMHPGGNTLTDRLPAGGVVTIHELLVQSLTVSDNSAADALLRLVGGPRSLGRWLRRHGLADLRIDRTEMQIGLDWYGVTDLPPESTWTAARLRALQKAVPANVRNRAARAMAEDPRDQAPPAAVGRLLERLWRGELLSPAMTDTARAILHRCATSPERLPGRLPRGTPVARKTGTGGARQGLTLAVNDAGVIRLPNGDDAVVVAMVADARGPVAATDRAIALAARAVYDAWAAAR